MRNTVRVIGQLTMSGLVSLIAEQDNKEHGIKNGEVVYTTTRRNYSEMRTPKEVRIMNSGRRECVK